MNEIRLYFQDWKWIMRQALSMGLLVFGIVFLAGVLMGWAYGLLIGFIILLLLNLAGKRS